MDVLVRRGLPLRSWQAEESRTRMSKVLLKRRLPWPSGLILGALHNGNFGFRLALSFPSGESPEAERSDHPPDNRSRQASFAAHSLSCEAGDASALAGQI